MDEAAYRRVASYISKGHKVVILTGAGISAESGVPTFRSSGGPIWREFWDPAQLSHKEMLKKDLKLVWEWFCYRRELIRQCHPNLAHQLLVEIESIVGPECFTIITQNVDGLHKMAGSKNIIEVHGCLWNAKGMECTHKHPLLEPLEQLPPTCPTCSNPLRPDVVLFGEGLKQQDWDASTNAAHEADLFLVIGTSSLVYPAAELPFVAKGQKALLVEVNPQPSLRADRVDVTFSESAVSFAQHLQPYLLKEG